jgi:hypothetical protein
LRAGRLDGHQHLVDLVPSAHVVGNRDPGVLGAWDVPSRTDIVGQLGAGAARRVQEALLEALLLESYLLRAPATIRRQFPDA